MTSGRSNASCLEPGAFDRAQAASFSSAFVTANGGTPATAETALFVGFAGGKADLHTRTSGFGGGEIRGAASCCFAGPNE